MLQVYAGSRNFSPTLAFFPRMRLRPAFKFNVAKSKCRGAWSVCESGEKEEKKAEGKSMQMLKHALAVS